MAPPVHRGRQLHETTVVPVDGGGRVTRDLRRHPGVDRGLAVPWRTRLAGHGSDFRPPGWIAGLAFARLLARSGRVESGGTRRGSGGYAKTGARHVRRSTGRIDVNWRSGHTVDRVAETRVGGFPGGHL